MRIVIGQNRSAIDFIKGHLIKDECYDNMESFVTDLKEIIGNPSVFLCIALDGEDVKGFILATAPPRYKHVFLWQVWVDPTVKEKIAQKLFFRLNLWASSLKRMEIRAETKRNTDAVLRKWNFKEISSIVSYKIPDDFDIDYLESVQENKEKENGGKIGNGHREQSNSGSNKDSGPVGGVHSKSSGKVESVIPRPVDSRDVNNSKTSTGVN